MSSAPESRPSTWMRFPIRPVRGAWPGFVERRLARFCWTNPRLIEDDDPDPAQYSRAMAAFRIGETFKITGLNRHAVADELLTENVAVTDSTAILDIGASDGSTSVDLIRRLPAFGSYVIADISLRLTAADVGRSVLFFDHEGRCILVVGRRLVAWPSLSRLVRLLYLPMLRRADRQPEARREVLMLNPAAKELLATDPRVSCRVHDVFERFQPPDGQAPDLIKVANLLRRLYFDDVTLRRGLVAIMESLSEGGHLLIVDNPRAKGVGPRAGVYRRDGGRFVPIASTPEAPEIDDLIRATALEDLLQSGGAQLGQVGIAVDGHE